MSLITAIEISEDDPNFREIYVDDEHVARVDAATVTLIQLEVGSAWAQEQSSAVALHQDQQEARAMAMDLISRRMWGSQELRSRLIQRGVQKEIAELVINSLLEDDWLDDVAYAEALIRETTRKEPAGKFLLREKLTLKHISSRITEAAIETYTNEVPAIERAKICLELRIKKIDPRLLSVSRNRLVKAVIRRGFTTEVVQDAFYQLLSESS